MEQVTPIKHIFQVWDKELELYTQYIYDWGIERNITREGGSSVKHQTSYCAKELIETAFALGQYSQIPSAVSASAVYDGYGDSIVCIIQAKRIGGATPALIVGAIKHCLTNSMENRDTLKLPSDHLQKAAAFAVQESLIESLQEICNSITKFAGYVQMDAVELTCRALRESWFQIRDRKGKMVRGHFVKDE